MDATEIIYIHCEECGTEFEIVLAEDGEVTANGMLPDVEDENGWLWNHGTCDLPLIVTEDELIK